MKHHEVNATNLKQILPSKEYNNLASSFRNGLGKENKEVYGAKEMTPDDRATWLAQWVLDPTEATHSGFNKKALVWVELAPRAHTHDFCLANTSNILTPASPVAKARNQNPMVGIVGTSGTCNLSDLGTSAKLAVLMRLRCHSWR